MDQIIVNLKRSHDDSYPIFIGENLLQEIPQWIQSNIKSSRFIIITDHHVEKLYGKKLVQLFIEHNSKVELYSFKPGESSKTREIKSKIENWMLQKEIGRDSCILALGGGVTGDLAGFVAATYLRGIPFIQIPTTLLSQVDSSIGGKVAVDTSYAKNMIGAFYQPKAVFIDTTTLLTLPGDLKFNGLGEIIKHAIIQDRDYFEWIEKNVNSIKNLQASILIPLIKRSCEIKAKVVEEDERENGKRKILNFGHTIGHALESLMDYKMLHDHCVCIGMVAELNISKQLNWIDEISVERIKQLLMNFNLPVSIPKKINLRALIKKTYLDKKVQIFK